MATCTAENHSSSWPPRKLSERAVLPSATGAAGSMRRQLNRLKDAYVRTGRRFSGVSSATAHHGTASCRGRAVAVGSSPQTNEWERKESRE